jgi:hypothetical protein
MKKNICILIFVLASTFNFAEKFRYVTGLPPVDSSGFYKIQITPQINSKLKTGFADLRLFDNEQKEVPYLLRDDTPVSQSSSFQEYEIFDRKYLKDSITQIIIKNKAGGQINNISLVIRNADVQKEMELTGSFDGKQWFVVKESEIFSSSTNDKDIAEIKLINFPLTNYTFYRIELNDRYSAPVDIIKAGYYETTTVEGLYTELKPIRIISDSAKQNATWVHLLFEYAVNVDEIEFEISQPAYYLRPVDLFYSTGSLKNEMKLYPGKLTLNSKSSLRFHMGGIRVKEVWLKIFNADNPPLRIAEVRCFQLNHYSIANLEKGKQYELRFGDSLLDSPDYDIKYFQSVIPSNLRVVLPGNINEIQRQLRHELKENGSIFSDKRFIWAALSVVILLLGFVTFRMLRSMK